MNGKICPAMIQIGYNNVGTIDSKRDKTIIEIILKSKDIDKYVAIGILAMLMYQQIQNIGMNIGLLPITGITLPFMSYGGSSTLSYMLALGIILNIDKSNKKI